MSISMKNHKPIATSVKQERKSFSFINKRSLFMIAILVMSLAFNSCSNNNDSPQLDPLIGKWKLIQKFEDTTEILLNDCVDLRGILEFKVDGSLTNEKFEEISGTCTLNGSFDGSWTNNNNGTYTFTFISGTQLGQVTFNNDTVTIVALDGTTAIKTIYQKQ